MPASAGIHMSRPSCLVSPVSYTHLDVYKRQELTRPNTVRVRTWERGAGPTMACGTGACATAVVLNELGLTGPAVDIQLEAGRMHICLLYTSRCV